MTLLKIIAWINTFLSISLTLLLLFIDAILKIIAIFIISKYYIFTIIALVSYIPFLNHIWKSELTKNRKIEYSIVVISFNFIGMWIYISTLKKTWHSTTN